MEVLLIEKSRIVLVDRLVILEEPSASRQELVVDTDDVTTVDSGKQSGDKLSPSFRCEKLERDNAPDAGGDDEVFFIQT
jgi:hypothetical protein